jgi:hypothetical protein
MIAEATTTSVITAITRFNILPFAFFIKVLMVMLKSPDPLDQGAFGSLLGTPKNSMHTLLPCKLPHFFGKNPHDTTGIPAFFAYELQ